MKTLNDVNKKNDVKSKAAEEVKAEPEKIDFSKVKIEPLFEEAVDFDTFSKSDFRQKAFRLPLRSKLQIIHIISPQNHRHQ